MHTVGTYAEASKDLSGCSLVGLGMKGSGVLAECQVWSEKPDTCQSYLMS